MEIPGYRIDREIGQGGMATIYLAVQESLNRPVALKVMAPSLAANPTFSERFLREAHTVGKLSHPHIVAVYDVGVVDHNHYIAMEYVDGGDLKQRQKSGEISVDEALTIISQIASALGYAHEKGFVHRDIKPENILFREDGSAVLSDFGIAKAVDSATRMTGTGMSIGTPHYMSPEQAQGKDEIDVRSDLYSLGIVLYEMLIGKVPFEADNTIGVAMQHVQAPIPELPSNLSKYQPLLDRLLAKQVEQRYQSANELIQAIEQVKSGTRLQRPEYATKVMKSTEVASPNTTRNISPQSDGLKWGLGGGLLAVLVGVGVYVWQQNQSPTIPRTGQSNISSPVTRETNQGKQFETYNAVSGRRISESERMALVGEMVDIPSGSFQFGSGDSGKEERSVRNVHIKSFRLGRYEVTQRQWRAVMGNNPFNFKGCDECPVDQVEWSPVQEFIQKLNNKTGGNYRLPTEVEWEYACRSGGKTEKYCGGDDPDSLAWYENNSGGKIHPVGRKQPNGLGLYDMSGNVWEFTQSCLNNNYEDASSDDAIWRGKECNLITIRGGSWGDSLEFIRSEDLYRKLQINRPKGIGFRLAQDLRSNQSVESSSEIAGVDGIPTSKSSVVSSEINSTQSDNNSSSEQVSVQTQEKKSANKVKITGIIVEYICGDNCYLSVKASDGKVYSGLCHADYFCENYNWDDNAMNKQIGKNVTALLIEGRGRQSDGEGNVVGYMDAFVVVKPSSRKLP